MKTVILQRAFQNEAVTMGMLKIAGVEHDPIFTLENPLRDTTVDSLIPSGTYRCIPYSGTKYKDVYWVENVPGRSAILIHPGNFERDTMGCILLGLEGAIMDRRPAVIASKDALKLLKRLLNNELFSLVISDAKT